jgi:hypothetical protein
MGVIEIRALNGPDRDSGQTMGDFGMKTIDLLIAMFPGKAQIPATLAGRALGYADSSVRNMIHKATFPVETIKEGDKRMVRLIDLAAYMEKQKPAVRRGRGRPRKKAPSPTSSTPQSAGDACSGA